MATESSRTTALRALVMLSCLVAIPAVAISGKSLPEIFHDLVPQRWQRQTASSVEPSPEPEGVTWKVAPEEAQAAGTPGDAAAVGQPPAETSLTPQWPVEGGDPLAAGPNIGAVAASFGTAASAGHGAPVARSGLKEAASLVPIRRPPDAFLTESATRTRVEQVDRFSQTQRRLRQLGATYYLLESWGQSGQLFRFCCRVAVAGSPNYTRHFEAINPEPLLAMSEVLAEVEAWRAGR